MTSLIRHPTEIFLFSLALQWLAAYLGHALRRRGKPLEDAERGDFNTILGATLTLAALIIGFSFSMAVSRYDERKASERNEANAIRAAYVRAPLLPSAEGGQTRRLLSKYAELRIQFYNVSDPARLARIDAETEKLQDDLLSIVTKAAVVQPTPTVALAAAAMTDVLNSRGSTQAAWWNRIPTGAWSMMLVIAFAANFLHGASERRRTPVLLFVLPLIISAPIFLIADIDAPRAGVVRIVPDDLLALRHWMDARP
ncbi:MAG TPA: hypothetical protein VGG92_18380 [Caulobacteraceae bacterium]|jgi:hypothetical protein